MITKVLINSVINLVFDSVLIFFIFYSIFYFIFKDKIKTKKILKVLLITVIIIFSLVISSDSDVRRYRKYTLDYKEVSTLSFLGKAVNDYINGETINIYPDNIKVIMDIPNKNFKSKKTRYLDIDNGKYIIPVDNKNKEISTLAEELYYNQEEYTYIKIQ